MPIGFGPSTEMIKSQKANRAQLKKRKSLKEIQSNYGSKKEKNELTSNKMSNNELERFKQKLAEDKRRDKIKAIGILGAIIFVVFVVFYLILF